MDGDLDLFLLRGYPTHQAEDSEYAQSPIPFMKKPMLLENDGLCNFTPVTEDMVPTVSDNFKKS